MKFAPESRSTRDSNFMDMAGFDGLECSDLDIWNMTCSQINNMVGSYSIEFSNSDDASEMSHYPSKDCFMVELDFKSH
jgi:hypothetical protein